MTLLADYRRWSEAQSSYSGAIVEIRATVALSPQRVTAHCTLGFTHSHTHLQTVTQTNIYAVDIYTQHVRVDISVKSLLMLLCSPVYMVKGSMPPRRVAKLLCTPARAGGPGGKQNRFCGNSRQFCTLPQPRTRHSSCGRAGSALRTG